MSRTLHTGKLWRLKAMTHMLNHDTLSWPWSERQPIRRRLWGIPVKALGVSPVERSSQPPPAAHLLLVIDWKPRKREDHNMITEIQKVPIHLKMTLTIKEAAEYSNIGINKIESLLRTPNCPFVLYVGTKKLLKRKEFEEFISKKTVI